VGVGACMKHHERLGHGTGCDPELVRVSEHARRHSRGVPATSPATAKTATKDNGAAEKACKPEVWSVAKPSEVELKLCGDVIIEDNRAFVPVELPDGQLRIVKMGGSMIEYDWDGGVPRRDTSERMLSSSARPGWAFKVTSVSPPMRSVEEARAAGIISTASRALRVEANATILPIKSFGFWQADDGGVARAEIDVDSKGIRPLVEAVATNALNELLVSVPAYGKILTGGGRDPVRRGASRRIGRGSGPGTP
jgi:hypothetical protein